MPHAPPPPSIVPHLSQDEIKKAGPVLTPEERAKVLADIDKMYTALGYAEDEIIKLPMKYVVKIAQVASESTMSACIKYLENVPESLKAYLVANVLPDDYEKEAELARMLAKTMNDVGALKVEMKAMREMVDSLAEGKEYESDEQSDDTPKKV